MKKFCFNFQMRNNPFLIVIYHSSLVKGAMNAARVCNLRNGVKKTPQFLLFSQAKGGTKTIAHLSIAEGSSFESLDRLINVCKLRNERKTKCAMNILRSYLNCWHNWQLKNRRRSHTLTAPHSMGNGLIFLKSRRDASFKKYLSIEPNFNRIHLAEQYL
jgi:hypothetical protein